MQRFPLEMGDDLCFGSIVKFSFKSNIWFVTVTVQHWAEAANNNNHKPQYKLSGLNRPWFCLSVFQILIKLLNKKHWGLKKGIMCGNVTLCSQLVLNICMFPSYAKCYYVILWSSELVIMRFMWLISELIIMARLWGGWSASQPVISSNQRPLNIKTFAFQDGVATWRRTRGIKTDAHHFPHR